MGDRNKQGDVSRSHLQETEVAGLEERRKENYVEEMLTFQRLSKNKVKKRLFPSRGKAEIPFRQTQGA